jgi:hypothetical protein
MKKGFWNRFFAIVSLAHLVLAVLVGLAAGYLLGNVLGMGFKGWTLGFVLGVGLVFGGLSIFD